MTDHARKLSNPRSVHDKLLYASKLRGEKLEET
jgi:hypothetical protein